ncbi:MAG TPA: TraR/DksA C4-type zinc finger protein [Candidatus Sulfotelmatobacter sp.]|nr:TraR/DksA C4-type zinc finger protein [Candidatus Sulfotelmatobacter sp.]
MENDTKILKLPQARGKSSTSEILGGTTGNGRVPAKWAAHHKRLRQLRRQFLENKSTRSESAKMQLSSSGEHIADAATDSYERDYALALISSDQNALYEIDEALNRIVTGTYGTCELTGRPIEAARLQAIPWTRFSTRAQAELEARGASSRTHLGQLGSWASSGETETLEEDDWEESAPEREREAA